MNASSIHIESKTPYIYYSGNYDRWLPRGTARAYLSKAGAGGIGLRQDNPATTNKKKRGCFEKRPLRRSLTVRNVNFIYVVLEIAW
jgi:hypothetical protein